MQKFHLKLDIQKPVGEVFSLFTDRTLMSKWQPGLVSDDLSFDKKGGKHHKLIFRIGRRSMPVTETIIRSTFPNHDVSYKLKGITNTVKNTFIANGPDATIWISDTEFRFRWLMILVGIFMKPGLEQQSKIIMHNFKSFAEKTN